MKYDECNKLTPCQEALVACGQDILLGFVPGGDYYAAAKGGYECGENLAAGGSTFDKLDAGVNCTLTVAGAIPGAGWVSTGLSCLWNITTRCGFHYSRGQSAGAAAWAAAKAAGADGFDTGLADAFGAFFGEMQAVSDWIAEFFGAESWAELDGAVLRRFLEDVRGAVGEGHHLALADVLAFAPTGIGEEDVARFVERWNRTADELAAGTPETDGGEEPGEGERIRFGTLAECAAAIREAEATAEAAGAESAYDLLDGELRGAIRKIEERQKAVCASVELKLSQSVVLAREAFEGTLTLYNGHESGAMGDIRFEVEVTDDEGNPCNGLFGITGNGTTGMTDTNVLESGAELAARGTGTAKVLFVPTPDAAGEEAKRYWFGGTLKYDDPFSGSRKEIAMKPVGLMVNSTPELHLDYFVQRDVYGDDPYTTNAVEASLPAELAVLVRNEGWGDAKDVRISSMQPETVRNEKGLAIEFRLSDYSRDAMALNGATAHLGLNDVSLGTVTAKCATVAQWWLTASIQGHFTGMAAQVAQRNSWGNPDTSLIRPENVKVHKLIRSMVADADGLPDFLTSEEEDLYGVPDTIVTSSGAELDVAPAGSVAVSGTLVGAEVVLEVAVEATRAGWTYGRAVVPGAERYEIAGVVRGDGTEMPLRNAWITDRVFVDGAEPVWETRLHVVDECAEGEQTYTVTLAAKPSDGPMVTGFGGLEDGAVLAASPDAVTVEFSTEVDGNTFGVEDLVLRWQGTRVEDLSGLSITGGGTNWRIAGVGAVCAEDGLYELVVQCAGIANLSGALGTSGKSVSWTASAAARPAVEGFEGFAGNAPLREVGAVTVVFTMPVEGFGAGALRLDGEEIPGVAVAGADSVGRRWVVSGLDALAEGDGAHTLTVVGEAVAGLNGLTCAADASVSWVRDTVGPSVVGVSREVVMGMEGFRMELDEAAEGVAIEAGAATLTRDGAAVDWPVGAVWTVDGISLVLKGLDGETGADGTYVLTIAGSALTDAAGNAGSGSASVTWTVDTLAPAEVAGLRIDPDLGESAEDGVTCEAAVTVRGALAADAVSVTLLARYASGTETVLAGPFAAESTELTCAVTLPGAGNLVLVVRCEDAAGNASETAKDVYLDAVPAEAAWDAVEGGVVCESAVLRFSAAVVAGDVTAARVSLLRDGVALALDGVEVSASGYGTVFTVTGLGTLCAETGVYELRFDGEGVRKVRSGLPMPADSAVAVAWTYQAPDTEPPVVVAVLIDGEEPGAERWDRAERIEVEFSEAVNVPELVASGLIGQAFKLFGRNGVVFAAAGAVAWNAASNAVAWTLPEGVVGYGEWRLVLDAGLLADESGNALSGEGWGTAEGLCRFAASGELFVSVAGQAAPSWGDIDGDGVAELLVGEKTAGGIGDVRVWRKAGTAEASVWEADGLLENGGVPVEVSASGCLGASVAVADLTGNGHADLAIGTWDGRIMAREGGAVAGIWGEEIGLADGTGEFSSARAVLCAADLAGAGWASIVVGGLDGRFREIVWWPDSHDTPVTTAWLTDGNGVPLSVAAGRSAPAMADVNADGLPDVVSGDAVGGFWAFLADGPNRWCVTPVPLWVGNPDASAERSRPAWGDADGDGVPDLLVGWSDGGVKKHARVASAGPCVAFTVLRTPPTLAEALDAAELEWSNGGDASWSGAWTDSAVGGHAAFAGNGTSWLATATEGEGRLVSQWRTTGEGTGTMSLEADGRTVGTWAADHNGTWHKQTFVFGEGPHALRWTWEGNTGAEARLDAVVWTPSPWMELDTQADRTRDDFAEWLVEHGLATANASVETLTAASFEDTDGDGMDAWSEFVTMTDPNDGDDHLVLWAEITDGKTLMKWAPNHPEHRSYHIFAKKVLVDGEPWTDIGSNPDITDSEWIFFRMAVRLWE